MELCGQIFDLLNEIPIGKEVINVEESVKDGLLANLHATVEFRKNSPGARNELITSKNLKKNYN